jgi:HK97 family phage major capsid protein
MNRIQQLRDRVTELSDLNANMRSEADGEGRDLTPEERIQLKDNNDTITDLMDELEELERDDRLQARLTTSSGRRTDTEEPGGTRQAAPRVTRAVAPRLAVPARQVVESSRQRREQTLGFESMGHFLMAVRRGTISPQAMDERLVVRGDIATEYSSSDPGSEGGFAIPPDFRATVMEKIFAEGTLLGRTDQLTTSSNSITVPIDESEPWANTGLQVFWEAEGAQKRTSVLDLDQQTIRANKIAGVIPVTDELLEDAPALEGYIRRKVPERIDWKTSFAIVQGSGTGEPLGILNSPARVTVDAGAAGAGTIQSPHITSMYSRMPASSRGNAVWLVNPEVEPALMSMAFMVVPAASVPANPVPVYLPPNGLSSSPYASLMGRPVIPTQVCNPLGTEGDIIFADLSQYLTLVKSGGVRTDVSIHVFFMQDITAFRFVLRIGGQPWWKRPIQPRTGTFTMSPFVTLEAR